MTRQHYIQLLNTNQTLQIVYNFYVDLAVQQNKPYLQPNEFQLFFPMWENHAFYFNKVLEFMEQKYDPRTLWFNNQIIKYI